MCEEGGEKNYWRKNSVSLLNKERERKREKGRGQIEKKIERERERWEEREKGVEKFMCGGCNLFSVSLLLP